MSLRAISPPEIPTATTHALSVDACPPTLRIVKSFEGVEEIRDLWTSWQQHPNAEIDFYLMICRLRPEVLRPHVIVVHRDGQPVCMLVGRLERKRVDFRVGYARIFRPVVRVLTLVEGGFLGNVSAENCDYLVDAIMKFMEQGEADAAHFHHINVKSPLYSSTRRVPRRISQDHFERRKPHWKLKLPASFSEYFDGLSRKQRHEFRRHAKILDREFPGGVRTQCHRDETTSNELLRQLELIAGKTYQKKLRLGFENKGELRTAVEHLCRQGTLHASIMLLNEEPRAFVIGELFRGTAYCWCMGYDPEFRKYSLGSLLLMRWIEEAYKCQHVEEISAIDFGTGDARYKTRVCNASWLEASPFIFAPTMKGLTLNVLHSTAEGSHLLASLLLRKSNLLEKTKRRWRRSAAE